MRFLGFHVFFLNAVIKSFSAPLGKPKAINKKSDDSRVTCNTAIGFSTSPRTSFPVYWQPDYFYPVEVCLRATSRPQQCTNSAMSLLQLWVHPFPHSTFVKASTSLPIPLQDFDADNQWCRTFYASEMAELVKGSIGGGDMGEALMFVEAAIIGKNDPKTYYNLFVTAAPYYLDSPNTSVDKHSDPHNIQKLHSVICRLPKCVVTAEGGLKATKTENFRIQESGDPAYDPTSQLLTDDMFSVTYYDCKRVPCPAKFFANEAK